MNKVYRLIWSETRQAWVVVNEHATSRGKPSRGSSSRISPAAAALMGVLASFGSNAQVPAPGALPTGGQVVGGQASIATSGATMSIQQSSQRAILNWQSFNIGANAAVNFQQPNASAVALNRVIGSDPSAIYGSLNANGQVFLLNPSGVVFGPGARVDVGGLVASTLNIRNEDFLSGNYRFTRDGVSGSVVNRGDLLGQYVALLAPEVRNEGVIVARQGTAALAGGEAVTLNIAGSNLVGVQVDKASIDTLVENRHLIRVDAGLVVLSAQSANQLVGKVVNTGTIQAGGISTDGGVVRLVASSVIELGGTVNADAGVNGKGGTVVAIADLSNPASRTDFTGSISAKGGTASGDGGFVETSATKLRIADSARVDTTAANGATGQWLLDPYDFTIQAINGDITGAALSAALGSSHVIIQTTDSAVSCAGATCGTGNSSGNGDIFVNDAVSWSSDKKLTLSAWRNVNISAPITASGGAGTGLALEFAQSGAEFDFPAGIYAVNAPVTLSSAATFTTKAANDGAVVNYGVITNATALANISVNLSGNFVLGSDIDLTAAGSWTPIGNSGSPYTGLFDGLGHKVMNLSHTNAGADVDVGLFGVSNSQIQNVGVTGVNIAGSQNVGALVGTNNGFVVNSYATGTVQGTGAGAVGRIGGLVGNSPGPIQGSYANVTVTATGGDQSGNPLLDGKGGIGGLAGVVASSVTDSYASGNVTGGNYTGGLVGYSAAGITNTYAAVVVTGGTANVGGLAGGVDYPDLFPFIFNSFWNTDNFAGASGANPSDGVTGLTTAQMQTPSTFTGAGWDTSVAWELRSSQNPLLKQLLQPIFVIADNKLSTYNGAAFTAFTSTVSPTTVPGGAYTGTVTFTPSTASPTNAGSYTVTPGGVSVTAPSDQNGYRVQFVDGTLVIDPAPLTTMLDTTASKTYDGTAIFNNTHTFTFAGMINMDPMPTVTGGQATVSSKNAGTYTSFDTNTLTLSDANYTLTGGTVSATINPKSVTLTAPDVTKTYDGGLTYTTIAGDLTALSGQLGVGGDSITAATIAYTNKNAGTGDRTVTLDAVTINDGNGGGNYTVTRQGNSTSTINKADLTLSGTRVYDATTIVVGDVLTAAGVNGETFAMTGSGDASNLASKNVQTGATLNSVTGLALGASVNGGDAGNYNAITITGSSVTISKKTLDVSMPPASSVLPGNPTPVPDTLVKIYDGSSVATVTGVSLKPEASIGTVSAGQFYAGDVVTLNTGGATGEFRNAGNTATANVADATKVAITGLTLTGADSGNYELVANPEVLGAIQKRTVTLTAPNVTKTYDGGLTYTTVAGDLTALSGQLGVGGDSITAATIAYTDKNAGTGNRAVTLDAVTISDGSGGNNYTVTRQGNSTSTINTAELTLSGTRVYDGTTVIAGTVLTATGVNGETFAVTGAGDASNLASKNVQTNVALNSLTNLALGTSGNGGVETNYNPISTTGSQVTIAPATLTYLADAASRNTGEANPAFTGSVTGFVPGENEGNATTGTRTFTSAAGIATPAGNYAINGSGLNASNGNYNFAQAPGNATALTIRAGTQDTATSTAIQQAVATTQPPPTTTTRPTTTTTPPTTTERPTQTTTTTAPPPAQISATTSNPTPAPGQSVPLTAPSSSGSPALDPSKPVAAVLVPASGDADVPMPAPKITQNANGTITVDVTVPPSTPPGVYVIAVVGQDASGKSRVIIVPVVVRRAATAA